MSPDRSPDRDDNRCLYRGQKFEHLLDIYLLIKVEYFNLEAEFGDSAKASGDVSDLRGSLVYRVHSKRHLLASGGHIGHVAGDVGVELVHRLLGVASHNVGFILPRGHFVVRSFVYSLTVCTRSQVSGFDALKERARIVAFFCFNLCNRIPPEMAKRRLTGYLRRKSYHRASRLVHRGCSNQSPK